MIAADGDDDDNEDHLDEAGEKAVRSLSRCTFSRVCGGLLIGRLVQAADLEEKSRSMLGKSKDSS
jgi:hypothetical protein